MDNKEILDFLKEYSLREGYGDSEEELRDTLECSPILQTNIVCELRWWTEKENIVEIGGRYISFPSAYASDGNAAERGWEFDWNEVYEVKPVEKTIVVYERV